MYEEQDVGEPWWWAYPDDEPPPVEWDEAHFEAEVAAYLAGMTPEERAERELGVHLDEPLVAPEAPTTEESAATAQDLLVQADRVHRIADARRVEALLIAWDRSIEDLRVRFGSEIGSRGGLGAQAFFRSMGLRLQMAPTQVAHRVDTALVARSRLPATWAVFAAGGTTWSRLATAVAQAEGLDPDRWAEYDGTAAAEVVESTRLRHDLRRARERLQDDTAPERAKAARRLRAAYLDNGPDGTASFTLTGPASDLVAIDQALTRSAVAAHAHDGEGRTVTQLRFDIARDLLVDGFGRLADPDGRVPQRAKVDVRLVLTVPALAWLGRTTEQALLDGHGPIDLQTAKALAGSASSMVRVLTDPVTGVRSTMDRTVYSPPADLARWVRIRDGRSRFPGGTRPAWLCDLDHAREWQHGGPTADWNLVALSRAEHLQKSAQLFQEELRTTGVVHWWDAWGNESIDPPADAMDPAPSDLLPARDPDEDPPF